MRGEDMILGEFAGTGARFVWLKIGEWGYNSQYVLLLFAVNLKRILAS
jgi:hypothetical protein